jgi:hypothetical protein
MAPSQIISLKYMGRAGRDIVFLFGFPVCQTSEAVYRWPVNEPVHQRGVKRSKA